MKKRTAQNLLRALIISGTFALNPLEAIANEPTPNTTITIPEPKGEKVVDQTQIYHGNINPEETKYENAACINFGQLIRATPEYLQIQKEKIEKGTGKYWILISKANGRVTKSVSEYGKTNNTDFIVTVEYAKTLKANPKIADVTEEVIESMGE